MVHWAQYMDVRDDSDQIGLITYKGQPRPAWWAFRWFSELPAERVVSQHSSSETDRLFWESQGIFWMARLL